MADVIPRNVVHFTWDRGGYADAFEVELSTGLLSFNDHWRVGPEHAYVGWPQVGIGNEFWLRARSLRTDALGEVTERGTWGPWADPLEFHPVPEPGTALLLAVGVVALGLLQRWRLRARP